MQFSQFLERQQQNEKKLNVQEDTNLIIITIYERNFNISEFNFLMCFNLKCFVMENVKNRKHFIAIKNT